MVTIKTYETEVKCRVPKIVDGKAVMKDETFSLKGNKTDEAIRQEINKRYGQGVLCECVVTEHKYGMSRQDFLQHAVEMTRSRKPRWPEGSEAVCHF